MCKISQMQLESRLEKKHKLKKVLPRCSDPRCTKLPGASYTISITKMESHVSRNAMLRHILRISGVLNVSNDIGSSVLLFQRAGYIYKGKRVGDLRISEPSPLPFLKSFNNFVMLEDLGQLVENNLERFEEGRFGYPRTLPSP